MRIKEIITRCPNMGNAPHHEIIRRGGDPSGLDSIAIAGLQVEIHATVNAAELFILHNMIGCDNILQYGPHGRHIALLYEATDDICPSMDSTSPDVKQDIQTLWHNFNGSMSSDYPFNNAVPMAFIYYDVALLFSGKEVSWVIPDIDSRLSELSDNIKHDIEITLNESLRIVARWFLIAEDKKDERLSDYYECPSDSNSFRQISISAGGKVFGQRRTFNDVDEVSDTVEARKAMDDSKFSIARVAIAGTVPMAVYTEIIQRFHINADTDLLWCDKIPSIPEYLESDESSNLSPVYIRLLNAMDAILPKTDSLERLILMPTTMLLHLTFKMDINVGPGKHPYELVNSINQRYLMSFKSYIGRTINILSGWRM